MAKTIGVIAEDDSDIDVVTNILVKYVDKNRFSIRKFVGNGCGKLRNKCGSWAANLLESGCQHVLLFHDLDRHEEESLRTILEKKVPREKFPASLIVIPIEEMEAWLLSDGEAIREVFSLRKALPRIGNCEAIKSPKEYLAKLVWAAGKKRYLNTTHNKKIAEKASIDNLRKCRSFKPLDEYIRSSIFGLPRDKRT